jgi:hypothetical protein
VKKKLTRAQKVELLHVWASVATIAAMFVAVFALVHQAQESAEQRKSVREFIGNVNRVTDQLGRSVALNQATLDIMQQQQRAVAAEFAKHPVIEVVVDEKVNPLDRASGRYIAWTGKVGTPDRQLGLVFRNLGDAPAVDYTVYVEAEPESITLDSRGLMSGRGHVVSWKGETLYSRSIGAPSIAVPMSFTYGRGAYVRRFSLTVHISGPRITFKPQRFDFDIVGPQG